MTQILKEFLSLVRLKKIVTTLKKIEIVRSSCELLFIHFFLNLIDRKERRRNYVLSHSCFFVRSSNLFHEQKKKKFLTNIKHKNKSLLRENERE